jgi:AbrB family looped-hinge helix DNA binding protein
MAKVTSKLQVTIPKRIADEYGIEPGDEIEFVPASDSIRVIPPGRATRAAPDVGERLHWFDAATPQLVKLVQARLLDVAGPQHPENDTKHTSAPNT